MQIIRCHNFRHQLLKCKYDILITIFWKLVFHLDQSPQVKKHRVISVGAVNT